MVMDITTDESLDAFNVSSIQSNGSLAIGKY